MAAAAQLTVPGPVAVTGAAGGIGFAVAREVVAAGTPVALLDRDEERLLAAAERLRAEAGGGVHHEVLDVAAEAEVAAAFERIADRLGPLRGLVTSAGIDSGGEVCELATTTFDEVLAVNLRGSFLAARAAIDQMLAASTGGSIVFISSPLGRVAVRGTAAYGASKAAVSALVRGIAVDYGRRGIRANALLPGPTETELMWASIARGEVAAMRETVASEVPLGRLADPGEPAAAALWLLSDQASYVTGAEIACDGGVLAKASVSI
jgi:NAD(P)-dependent dehydrogenase (short-subunit alcohol dehydrogenase family)